MPEDPGAEYILRRKSNGVSVSGQIDLGCALSFAEDTIAALREVTGDRPTIDLSGVSFMDSAGLQALITAVRATRRPLTIVASSAVYTVLDVVSLTDGGWDGVDVRRSDDPAGRD
jgi:anti-anti-sigma factor